MKVAKKTKSHDITTTQSVTTESKGLSWPLRNYGTWNKNSHWKISHLWLNIIIYNLYHNTFLEDHSNPKTYTLLFSVDNEQVILVQIPIINIREWIKNENVCPDLGHVFGRVHLIGVCDTFGYFKSLFDSRIHTLSGNVLRLKIQR